MKIRRFLVITFFALAVFLASIRSGPLVYGMLYLSVLLPLLSIIYTFIVYANIKVYQSIDSRTAVKQQPVSYICKIFNETHFLPFTLIELKFYTTLSEVTTEEELRPFTLAADSTEEIAGEVICRRRGRYSIGVKRILISDILGLVRLSFKPPVDYPVSVCPRVLHPESLGIFSFDGIRNASRSRETAAGDTVHEYVVGDDPRLIHWKASARTGNIQVRQLNGVERPSMVVVVDLRQHGDDETSIVNEDNLLEALLAICDYCIARGIQAAVYAGDNQFILNHARDFNDLYEWASGVKFSPSAPSPHIPDVYFTCCAMLSTGHYEESAADLLDVSDAGAECVLMEFCSESQTYETSRFKCIQVPDDCDILDILK